MRKKLLPILIIPLLTLICQHTASAYYDPGVQRWINRDPISDAGSMCFLFLRGHLGRAPAAPELAETPNIYEFAQNAPPRLIDYSGLYCGSPGSVYGGDDVIPDKPFGFDFSNACKNHDACYETCGARKAYCDRQFHKEMRTACDNSGVANPAFCKLLAYIYYKAVDKLGSDAYQEGQKKAHLKCCTDAGVPVDLNGGWGTVFNY